MKKIFTAFTLTISVTGCNSLQSLQGYVNQEHIKYTPESKSDRTSELYTYVVKVDELLKVYGKENNNKSELTLELEKLKLNGTLKNEETQKLIKLASDLDQLNSQNYPILFTIFMGLNANPSSKENRDSFWTAVNKVSDNTLALRKLELEQSKRTTEIKKEEKQSEKP